VGVTPNPLGKSKIRKTKTISKKSEDKMEEMLSHQN